VAHECLIRKCFLDYDREMALVAELSNKDIGTHELLGVGRLVRKRDEGEAELGLVVADRWHGAGLGTELMRRLIGIAEDEGIRCIIANILSENKAMLALAKHFHFHFVRDPDLKSIAASLKVDCHDPAA
jgi:acetyltransferase